MKIEHNTKLNKCRIGDVKFGTVVEHEGCILIVATITTGNEDTALCVSLHDGSRRDLSFDENVVVHENARLVVD